VRGVAVLADIAVFLMLPVVLIAGVLALLVSGMTVTPHPGPFVRLVQAGVAVVLAVDSLLLIAYAGGEDTYYGGGVTRWEHASRGGSTLIISIATAGALAASVCLVGNALAPNRQRFRPLASLAAAASCFLLIFAWLVLTAGH
jgi:hypothetical protein